MKKASLSARFAKRLRELRLSKKISLETLGERSGLNAKFVQAIETQRQAPTLHTVEKLAAGLKVSPEELFLFEERSPATLRARLNRITRAAEDRDLARLVRLLEAALH